MKLTALLLLMPTPSLCFWTKSPAEIATTREREPYSHGSEYEKNIALKRWNEVHVRGHHSDCFRDVSLSLHANCDSLEFDSDSRVNSAVRMTLCELTTAERVSIPLECKEMSKRATSRAVSRCVEALGRSAQHWSSYSGYLREIPQLCNAYRRLHEIDHAKSVYENITWESLSFLTSLNSHHSKLISHEQELDALAESMKAIVTLLGRNSNMIENSLARVPPQAQELVDRIHGQALSLLETIATHSQLTSQNVLSRMERHLRSTILEAQTALASSTKDLTGELEGLTNSLDAIALSWNSRLVAFNKRLDIMWDETFVRKMALDQVLEGLETRVSDTTTQLNDQLSAVEKLQELTSETSVSVQNTNAHFADASQTLLYEFQTLRSVAQDLQVNLTQIPHLIPGSGWIGNFLSPMWLIMNVFKSTNWQAQLVMQVVGVGASRIHDSLSLILTCGCALLFLVTHAFHLTSRIIKALRRWYPGGNKKLKESKSIDRPMAMVKHRNYSRPVASRSRVSAVLPHMEEAKC